MKKLFIIVVVLGFGYYLIPNSFTPKIQTNEFFWSFIDQRSRFEKRDKLAVTAYNPFVTQSREKATIYVPIFREETGTFAVPSAHASIIIDAVSGNVLYEESAHERRQIASLTKVYMALLVRQHVENLDEIVTIPQEVVDIQDGTRVGCPRSGYCTGTRLQLGEKLRVRDLLKAALMNSTNDAATALGIHVSGSEKAFVDLMNSQAKEWGLEDSHFCTPSGLETDGRESECYSSAHDIARITVMALKYPELWDIMRIQSATITSVDSQYSHDIANTNKLLGQYPNLLGTKTGFTPLAGYSLLAAASGPSGYKQIVSVVLDDQARWESIQTMFNWAYQTHDWK
jgi:serine-type D-Ala-D-Ala carboxypeptidase (penicillin-binding protein 5/6)